MQIKDRPITLGHKLRELITTKLKIFPISYHAYFYDWEEGAKDTLNPIPHMLHTLKHIWFEKLHWNGGSWRQTDNPNNITDETELSFFNKIYNSWKYVFKRLLNSDGIYWRQSNGLGSFGSTHFKIWTLTYYRSHTVFDGSNHREWNSKKHLFSKHWTCYDFKYFTDDIYGCSTQEVSQEEYEKVRDC